MILSRELDVGILTGATPLGKKVPLLFKKQKQHHMQSRGKEEPCTCAPSLLQGGL